MQTQRTDPVMKIGEKCHPRLAAEWDRETVAAAVMAARFAAIRGARRLGLSRADREDLQQDILVVLIQRGRHFDPQRSGWRTFAALIARHVVADRARTERESDQPTVELGDVDAFPSGSSITQQDQLDACLSLDLERVCAELPKAPQAILQLLGSTGDVAEAQRRSTQSCASFYRSLADLRFWLVASGLRPDAGCPRQMAGSPERKPQPPR